MKIKEIFDKACKKLSKLFFYPHWKCFGCGAEVFEEQAFCDECKQTLPYNDKAICDHCGRRLNVFSNYCSTCKGVLVSTDKCRSCFNYQPPISTLIKKAKYDNALYLIEYFAEQMSLVYFQNYFNADYLTFVPMEEQAEKKRGYNQSKLLAEQLSKKIDVPVLDCLVKKEKTKRQATLGRKERMENLLNAFKVVDKKSVANKTIVIIDDVTTTGSTAEVIASLLKKANAKNVYLITVASVPPFDKY